MSIQLGQLDETLSISPKNGREMVLLSRSIIHDWVNAKLPYPIEELDVLIGIESQSDHMLGGKVKRVFGVSPAPTSSQDEENELADLYVFFKQRYDDARIQLIRRLQLERS